MTETAKPMSRIFRELINVCWQCICAEHAAVTDFSWNSHFQKASLSSECRPNRVAVVFLLLIYISIGTLANSSSGADLANRTKLALKLESIRKKHNLPALGAAAIVDGRIVNYSVVGIRKVDSIVRAQVNDQFHLGSISKSMTGTLLGVLVEKGLMRWNMTLSGVFPELRDSMQPEFRNVTLLMLASHRAGFRDAGKGINAVNWHAEPGTPTELRYKYLRMELTNAPAYPPGTKTHYTFGFEIAAAMCERVTHRPYEALMKDWLFTPLGMSTAGFGPPGSKTVIDQPWQHRTEKGKFIPVEPDLHNDNPIVGRAGGGVHCSVIDLAKYLQAHAIGEAGLSRLMRAESFRYLHTMHFKAEQPITGSVSDNYGVGWCITRNDADAGGEMLYHTGSNLMNYTICWVAPKKKKAFCVVTDAYGPEVPQACTEALVYMIDEAQRAQP